MHHSKSRIYNKYETKMFKKAKDIDIRGYKEAFQMLFLALAHL